MSEKGYGNYIIHQNLSDYVGRTYTSCAWYATSRAFGKEIPGFYSDSSGDVLDPLYDIDGGGDDPKPIPKYNALNFQPIPSEKANLPYGYFDSTTYNIDIVNEGDIIGQRGNHFVYVDIVLSNTETGITCSQVSNDNGKFSTLSLYSVRHDENSLLEGESLAIYRVKKKWKAKFTTDLPEDPDKGYGTILKSSYSVTPTPFTRFPAPVIDDHLPWSSGFVFKQDVLNTTHAGSIADFRGWKIGNNPESYYPRFFTNPDTVFIAHTDSSQTAVFVSSYKLYSRLHLVNDYPGVPNQGTIMVNNQLHTIPAGSDFFIDVEQDQTVNLKAVDNAVINGIRYKFIRWSDGYTGIEYNNYTPHMEETLKAIFEGTPIQVSNIRSTSPYGQNIVVQWDPHPSPNVEYHVWEYVKNGQFEGDDGEIYEYHRVAVKPHGACSYTSGYKKTVSYTNDLLMYAVQAHYLTEDSYADRNFVLTVFGQLSFWNLDSLKQDKEVAFTEEKQKALAGIVVYPNPFNPFTNVELTLSENQHLKVEIYDIRGSLIRRLMDGVIPAGRYRFQWRGKDASGSTVASGIYILRVMQGRKQYFKRLIFTK